MTAMGADLDETVAGLAFRCMLIDEGVKAIDTSCLIRRQEEEDKWYKH